MLNLTAALCLAVALLMGGAGTSWSADRQKALEAYLSGDYATALREWTTLAEQGGAGSQDIVGAMYFEGKGAPRDYKAAVKWFRLAAEQGYAAAQFKLGFMYDYGYGVPQDNIRAHMWSNIAAANGAAQRASEKRDFLAKRMTTADISEAQRLARECTARGYKGC